MSYLLAIDRTIVREGGPSYRARTIVRECGPSYRARTIVREGGPSYRARTIVREGGPSYRARTIVREGGPSYRARTIVREGGPSYRASVPAVALIPLLSYTAPQPVSDVVCSSLSPSTLSVSWSPPTDPVLSYQVEVKQYSLEGSTVDTVSLSTPFDSENITTNTTVEGLGEY